MKYFHELSQEEIDTLIKQKKTWQFIMDNYKQPDWCAYHMALEGYLGCWSLTDVSKDGIRTKISKDYCQKCKYCFNKY